MYRQLLPRSARPAIYLGASRFPIVSRRLATTPSEGKPDPTSRPESSNTLIIISALGALGGLYYYYTRGPSAFDRESARRREEEVEKRVRELGEAGKNKVESVIKQGQQDYDQAKGTLQDSAYAARARAIEARTGLAERAQQGAHEAQVKFDELKNVTERRFGDVRDLSSKNYEERKKQMALEAENKTRGWFGWGGSK